MLRSGALHTGHFVNSMTAGLRVISSATPPAAAAAIVRKPSVLQAAVMGTSAGGLLSLAPVNEDCPVDMLLALQPSLARGQEHAAGLNPRAFRYAHAC